MVISKDTIWQGRVDLADDLLVAPGAVLTLRPGTEVVILPSASNRVAPEFISPMNEIIVRGRLRAMGSESDPVVFHSVGPGGEWGGIIIDASASVSLRHTVVGNASTAVMILSGRLVAVDSSFTSGRYGVAGFGRGAEARLERCLVSGNDYGIMRFSGAVIDTATSQVRDNRRADESAVDLPGIVADVAAPVIPPLARGVRRISYKNEVLTGDTVWQGVVRVAGLLRVAADSRLIILPGTVVEFSRIDRNNDGLGEAGIQVLGTLIAKGTPKKNIVFRSGEKEKKPGDWDAVNILGSDRGRNLIEYCRIENACRGLQLRHANVGVSHCRFVDNFRGIQLQDSLARIDHVVFFHNSSAVQARDSEVEFIANRILDNVNGANFFRLNLKAGGNVFANNLLNGLRIREGTSLISNNRISANRFGMTIVNCYSARFRANVITGNLEAGISCRRVDNIEIIGNFISANGIDGLRMVDSRAMISGNLINANGARGLRLDRFSGIITGNNIVLNRRYQVGVDGPVAVDARGNWWGGGDLDQEIYDGHDRGGVGMVDTSSPLDTPVVITWPLGDILAKVIWAGRINIAAGVGPLTVVKGAALELVPGTTVGFAAGAGLKVYGDITAAGLPGKRITFTSAGDKKAMSWDEVGIERSMGSRIENCDFEYGTWGLHCHFVPITVRGCRFVHNDGGIRFRSGPMDINGNLFRDNRIGIRGFMPEAKIRGNEFLRNEIAIFVRQGGHGMTIRDNNFLGTKRYDIRLGDFNTEDVAAEENWWSSTPLIFDALREPGIGRALVKPRREIKVRVGPWP